MRKLLTIILFALVSTLSFAEFRKLKIGEKIYTTEFSSGLPHKDGRYYVLSKIDYLSPSFQYIYFDVYDNDELVDKDVEYKTATTNPLEVTQALIPSIDSVIRDWEFLIVHEDCIEFYYKK